MGNKRFLKPQPQKPKPFKLCSEYLCSRCHLRIKSGKYKSQFLEMSVVNGKATFKLMGNPDAIPTKSPLDHWCFRCIAETPPVLRTRKTSKGELKKARVKAEEATAKKRKYLNDLLAERLRRQAEALQNRPPSVKRKKKGADEPFTLNLVYQNSGNIPEPELTQFDELNDYEILRERIAKTSDRTIFEQDCEKEFEPEEGEDEPW